jgi:hypothetical protein
MSDNIHKFKCDICDYKCCKQSEWSKHIITRKHLSRTNIEPNLPPKYVCKRCSREYPARNSLWYHEKKCDYVITEEISEDNVSDTNGIGQLTNMIVNLLKSNHELQKQSHEFQKLMIDMCKNNTSNTIVNTTTNTNSNNKFNINVFLNEDCKNAMNFEDFLNGIEVTQEDIQNNGKLGFVNGISKIIMDNLNMLSIHERPIHCTDWKREVMYIKDDNKWTREMDDKKMEDAIQVVSQKSIRTLHAWKMSNPDYRNSYSAFALECIDMQLHSVAGYHREVYYPKVAKLIARHVLLDRKNNGV